jgi:hypothetical protein
MPDSTTGHTKSKKILEYIVLSEEMLKKKDKDVRTYQ